LDVEEVTSLLAPPEPFRPLRESGLPRYLPMIRHGSNRQAALNEPVVCLSLTNIMRGTGTNYRPVASNPLELRRKFRLASDARVFVISVGFDKYLERYWALRRQNEVPKRLFELGIEGMSVPNFSFFTDAPGTHTAWNRRRMAIVASELSNAGIPMIPHLNATSPRDWEHWLTYLQASPEAVYVAKEFQTGLKNTEKARAAVNSLARLQGELGRKLHPLVVGGARLASDLAVHFDDVTFVDSQPFMKTVKRRRSRGRLWLLDPAADLSERLEENISRHRRHIEMMFAA
jgi:hypothetical protein